VNATTEVVLEVVKIFGSMATTILVPYMAWRLRQIEKNTNSKMDDVIKLTKAISEKKGKDDEQDAQKARDDVVAKGETT
jgi:hypothetical protein